MNTGLPGLVLLLAGLGYLALRRPSWLLFLWPISVFFFANLRNTLGPASLYWADLTSIAVLAVWARPSRMLPGGLAGRRWYGYLVGALVISSLASLARWGAVVEPGFWLVRYSLALSPLLVMPVIMRHRALLVTLAFGTAAAGIGMAILAGLQALSQPAALVIERFFYLDFTTHPDALSSYNSRVGEGAVASVRAYGSFGIATTFAGASVIVASLLVVIGRLIGWPLSFTGVAVAPMIAALLTYSRQGMLALVLAAVLALALDRRFLVFKVAALGLILLIVGSTISTEFLTERVQRGGVADDANLSLRLIEGPRDFFDRMSNDPSVLYGGVGLGAEQVFDAMESEERALERHGFVSNGFLLLVFFGGLPLFVSVIGFFWSSFRRGLRQRPALRALLVASLVAIAAVIASDNYGFTVPAIWFGWSMIGAITLVLAAAPQTSNRRPSDRRSRPPVRHVQRIEPALVLTSGSTPAHRMAVSR